MSTTYNALVWEQHCERLATQAAKGCGASHTVYVERVSAAIEIGLLQFSSEDRERAISVARSVDYATPQELEQEQASLQDCGMCPHGLEPIYCPVGCGDLP